MYKEGMEYDGNKITQNYINSLLKQISDFEQQQKTIEKDRDESKTIMGLMTAALYQITTSSDLDEAKQIAKDILHESVKVLQK